MESKGKKLRELMEKGLVVLPFCLDAYHALIAQKVGFDAVYMTGWGTAAERGYPDCGLITQTEMVQNARYIANAVELPVVCDADTGYGNAINVWRTVREYESAGVAAIHIEDQVFPKKCGFMQGKRVIPPEEHEQKIKAALDARRDKDFVIIARCDALAVNGWEDTIKRCKAYRKAGADLVFVDGVKTLKDLQTYATELRDIPKFYNGVLLPAPEIAKMGFKLMIAPVTQDVIYKAVKQSFIELKEKGTAGSDLGGVGTGTLWDETTEMLGLPRVYEMEKRYKAKES